MYFHVILAAYIDDTITTFFRNLLLTNYIQRIWQTKHLLHFKEAMTTYVSLHMLFSTYIENMLLRLSSIVSSYTSHKLFELNFIDFKKIICLLSFLYILHAHLCICNLKFLLPKGPCWPNEQLHNIPKINP